jgi:hypothetical protein
MMLDAVGLAPLHLSGRYQTRRISNVAHGSTPFGSTLSSLERSFRHGDGAVFRRDCWSSLRVRSGRHTLRQQHGERGAWASYCWCWRYRTSVRRDGERTSIVPTFRESIFFLSILLTFRDGRDLNPPKNHPGMSRVLGILFHKIAKPVLLKERWIPAYLGDWWLPHCDRQGRSTGG